VPHEISRCTSGHHNDAHRFVARKNGHRFQESVTHFRIEKDTGWTPQGYEGYTVLDPRRKNLRTSHHPASIQPQASFDLISLEIAQVGTESWRAGALTVPRIAH
jgi:hypothetical protein